MSNPLLEMKGLPLFSMIKPEHIEPAIDALLTENRQKLQHVLKTNAPFSWQNLVAPQEDMEDRLSRAWSPVSHYGDEYQQLDTAQQKVIDNVLRDFHLSGVDLSAEKKTRYKEIKQRLSQLTTKFEENILDATHAWHKHITDESLLKGLPASAIAMAKQTAQEEKLEGWLFTLDFPSYFAVMSYADDRQLREEMHQSYVTRASDKGPNAGEWDNSEVMDEILALRHELANLLGFNNYAERSLATKMAANIEQVLSFMRNLAERSKPMAEKELAELEAFAKQQHAVDKLEPWDLTYYSEKLRQETYSITQEELKPYFPETRVIPGMFDVVKRLYGLQIKQVEQADVWHDDVHFYEIRDAKNNLRGQFYLDLYTRAKKRGGAWMDDCVGRRKLADDSIQIPVAYLTCNLTPPLGDDPALFTHDEVITLFHEFGHGLHHMLTKVDYIDVSGINGVAWDAVELPSQFMENWCWEREALDVIAAHYQTNEPMPDALYQRMYAAKNFQSGMQMVRQLELSLFDFRLHAEYTPQAASKKGGYVQQVLDEVRKDVSVVTPAAYNRFQHGFSHIFAGGYAAGYYSYKWAEVLSADAFSFFEEKGIFDTATGAHFMQTVLEQGGTREPMALFVEFRGK